jgi:hypothetical protein
MPRTTPEAIAEYRTAQQAAEPALPKKSSSKYNTGVRAPLVLYFVEVLVQKTSVLPNHPQASPQIKPSKLGNFFFPNHPTNQADPIYIYRVYYTPLHQPTTPK